MTQSGEDHSVAGPGVAGAPRRVAERAMELLRAVLGRLKAAWIGLPRSIGSLPCTIRVTTLVALVYLGVFIALRIAFWIVYGAEMKAGAGDAVKAFYVGSKFDLRLALIITLPVPVAMLLPRVTPCRCRPARGVLLAYLTLAAVTCLFLYIVDFGQYGWERTRLNASVLEVLHPLGIALAVAWQSYPVVPGVILLAAAGVGFALLMRRFVLRQLDRPSEELGRWRRRGTVAAFVVLYAFGLYGKLAWFPLRWSEAYFTDDAFVSALGLNPILYFASTLQDPQERVDEDEVRASYDLVADLLEIEGRDRESLDFTRHVAPSEGIGGSPNVVLIHLESFAAFQLGCFGNKLDPTPNFDRIAAGSLLFTNFFVPRGPTARSVFQAFVGLPDLNGGRSSSRNPRLINQHMPLLALDDYEKLYFLGGSANWANIRGLLAHNLPGLKIYEEGDYESPSVDVWGISDLSLFEEAHKVFVRQQKPFFAFVQTAGYHRPYTIPDDNRGFTWRDAEPEALRANGFQSPKQYNAMRFFDHAIGHFFSTAAREPYFKRTIFLMYGDHGVNGTSAIPWEQIGLCTDHVPLAIYAPGYIRQGRALDFAASQLDIMPTIMGMLGRPYAHRAFGRDLRVPRPADRHRVFVFGGMLDDEFFWKWDELRGHHLYRYRGPDPAADLIDELPRQAEAMEKLYRALFMTAQYIARHNPPIRESAARGPGDG